MQLITIFLILKIAKDLQFSKQNNNFSRHLKPFLDLMEIKLKEILLLQQSINHQVTTCI